MKLIPGARRAYDAFFHGLHPISFKQIREHRKVLDFDNPRDFLGMELHMFARVS